MVSFVLGHDAGDYLRIDVSSRENPRALDSDDGNWLVAQVSVAAGPWKGSYRANLRAEEFRSFRDELRTLYDDPGANAAHFESLEAVAELSVERKDLLGHITVNGRAQQ